MNLRERIAVLILAALVSPNASSWTTAACSQDRGNDFSSKVTSVRFEATGSGEVVDAERGEFSVSENRLDQNSRQITLKYIRFVATGENPGSPIVYLAGGPGGSATGAGRGPRFDMFMALRELGDVILLDQRGTGLSNSLPDGAAWSIPNGTAATREDYERAALLGLSKSLDIWQQAGVDLAAYNTEESADDLAALCRVLRTPKIRLVGISYGTHLATAMMRRHPQLVERVVLAGVEGPDDTLKLPDHQQALLQRIQGWIDVDADVREVYPDFNGTLARVLDKLESSPEAIGTGSNKSVVTKFEVQLLVANMLRGPETFAMLPRLVRQMDEGNFSGIQFMLFRLRRGSFGAMPLAMDVASGASKQRLQQIADQAANTLLGDAINFPIDTAIRRLDKLDLGPEFRSSLVSSIPVLAISGTADGRTPPEHAEALLDTLSNGHHLLIHGAGHSDPLFLSSPKILHAMIGFLSGQDFDITEIRLPTIRFTKWN